MNAIEFAPDSAAAPWAARQDDAGVALVINPASEEVIPAFRNATVVDVDAAVQKARKAARAWGQTPPSERADVLIKIAAAIENEADEFARLDTSS